jgi:hypothetical protein
MRGCMGLGYDWSDYLAGVQAPANARVTSPNGDVLVFDDSGTPDYTIPHAGSGSDGDIDKDPSSPFYGWTNLQKAAYAAAQGVIVGTDALRASIDPVTNIIPQSAIAANQAALSQLATTDPTVKAALLTLQTGAFGSNTAAVSAANQSLDDAALLADAQNELASLINAGEIFADTIPAGMNVSGATGLITRQQWIDDYISVAKGGQPTNRIAAQARVDAQTASDAAAAAAVASSATSSGVALVASPSASSGPPLGPADISSPSVPPGAGHVSIPFQPYPSTIGPSGTPALTSPVATSTGMLPSLTSLFANPLVLAGAAGVGVLMLSRKKKQPRRRR